MTFAAPWACTYCLHETGHASGCPGERPCGSCFLSGWYGSRTGEYHHHCYCGQPCEACS